MIPHFKHIASQSNRRRLFLLFLSITLAANFIVFDGSETFAATMECPATDLAGSWRLQGTLAWVNPSEHSSSSISKSQRDIYGELVPMPVFGVASYMPTSTVIRDHRGSPEITAIGGCLRQEPWAYTLWNEASIKFDNKTKSKSFSSAATTLLLPRIGKKPVFSIRMTPPETGIVGRDRSVAFIGPIVQRNIQVPDMAPAPTVESASRFGGQPIDLTPLRGTQQLPDVESLRMNLATALTLHGGTCANGCP